MTWLCLAIFFVLGSSVTVEAMKCVVRQSNYIEDMTLNEPYAEICMMSGIMRKRKKHTVTDCKSDEVCVKMITQKKEDPGRGTGLEFTSRCQKDCIESKGVCGVKGRDPCVHCCTDDECGTSYLFHTFLSQTRFFLSFVVSTKYKFPYITALTNRSSAAFDIKLGSVEAAITYCIGSTKHVDVCYRIERYEPSETGRIKMVIIVYAVTFKSYLTSKQLYTYFVRLFEDFEMSHDDRFRYIGNLSQPYFLSPVGTGYCPVARTQTPSRFVVAWPSVPAAQADITVNMPCGGPKTFATRKCQTNGKWSTPVDEHRCPGGRQATRIQEDLRYPILAGAKLPIGHKNPVDDVRVLSIFMKNKTKTKQKDPLTAAELAQVTDYVNRLSRNENYISNNTAPRLLGIVDIAMGSDQKTLEKFMGGLPISARLRATVRNVADLLEVGEKSFSFSGRNLALLSVKYEPEKFSDSATCTGYFDNEYRTIWLKMSSNGTGLRHGYINIELPMKSIRAIYKKLTLEKMTFSAYRTGVLFTPTIGPADWYASKTINSWVLTTKLHGYYGLQNKKISSDIVMKFRHNDQPAIAPVCVSWMTQPTSKVQGWTEDYCVLTRADNETSTCMCSKLASLGLLTAGPTSKEMKTNESLKSTLVLHFACGAAACPLLVTAVTYLVFCRRFSRHSHLNIMFCACLTFLVGSLTFVIGMHDYTVDDPASCSAIALIMHVLTMMSACWLVVDAAHALITTGLDKPVSNFTANAALPVIAVTSLSAVITLGHGGVDSYGKVADGLCAIKRSGFKFAFLIPFCLMMVSALLMYGFLLASLVKSDVSKKEIGRVLPSGIVYALAVASYTSVFLAFSRDTQAYDYLFAVMYPALGFAFVFFFNYRLRAMKRDEEEEEGEQDEEDEGYEEGTAKDEATSEVSKSSLVGPSSDGTTSDVDTGLKE